MNDPTTASPGELRDWLAAGCALSDSHFHRAAIGLLDFADLLDRRDIRRHIEVDPEHGAAAWVNWRELAADPDLAPISGGADRLLRLAVSIAHGTPVDLQGALSGLGGEHARAVLAAVAGALGIAEDIQITDAPAYLERKRAENAAIEATLAARGTELS